MGDNIWLGDRDGVRTPMQWTPDRNAAFSRAESARLYAPVISDSVYGHQSINVEAQEKSPFSLLNWMKRLVQVRKQHHAFGRGSIEFLQPENPHVLAYLREHGRDSILVVNNLSGTAQAVRLDLSRFSGCVPVEMLGHTEFLPIDETPYALTLSPYGFFWFAIRSRAAGDDPGEVDESLAREWAEQDMRVLESRETVAALVGAIPVEWLAAQRWFRGKGREVVAVELRDHAVVAPEHGPRWMVGVVQVRFAAGEPDTYLLPLSLRPPLERGVAAEPIASVAMETGEVRLYEALVDRYTALALLRIMREEEALPSATGRFRGHRVAGAVPEGEHGRLTPVKRMSAEQSNTSIVFGERLIMKLFRKLEAGVNPDLEVTRFLVENTEFRGVPALAGWLDYTGEGVASASVAGVFRFIPNSGDAWAYTRRALDRFFAAASRSAADPSTPTGLDATRRMMGDFHAAARSLGRVTGELHAALASAGPEHPDFAPELVTEDDVREWTDAYQRDAARVLDEVGRRLESIPGVFPAGSHNELGAIVREAADLRYRADDLRLLNEAGLVRTRTHGDYHLGQVLRASDPEAAGSEWFIMDFEGEPARPLAERRAKQSPLRDVAGMLRSFDYAVRMALAEQETGDMLVKSALEGWADSWLRMVRGLFLEGYAEAARGAGFVPDDPETLRRVLAVFELEKAVYELGYEMNNRPAWIWVPIRGIRALLEGGA
jgi:maltose alpha-D-glucosyltransferase/alpha-amylase